MLNHVNHSHFFLLNLLLSTFCDCRYSQRAVQALDMIDNCFSIVVMKMTLIRNLLSSDMSKMLQCLLNLNLPQFQMHSETERDVSVEDYFFNKGCILNL